MFMNSNFIFVKFTNRQTFCTFVKNLITMLGYILIISGWVCFLYAFYLHKKQQSKHPKKKQQRRNTPRRNSRVFYNAVPDEEMTEEQMIAEDYYYYQDKE